MRQEDKQVDGPELERDASLRESALEQEQDEEQLPKVATEHQVDPAIEHRSQLLGAMRMILDREHLVVTHLRLPQREQRALEALQAAVTGKSTNLDQFVYAADRSEMLEQALAVLQANLTRGDDRAVAELHAKFGTLVSQVAQLRGTLKDLADGQDELLEANQKVGLALGETDSGDKPKPKPDADASLTGPERPVVAQPSTLSGPDLPAERPQPSTLSGADLPPERPQPSTLSGADLPAERPQPSTLSGADLPPEPAAESSVWDADTPIPPPPIARAQELQPKEPDPAGKKPWWKRPFG